VKPSENLNTCYKTHAKVHITGPFTAWHWNDKLTTLLTRMWANAQRDGRPAKYRWRPLFNATVWLMPTSGVPCSNAAKRRNPLKFAGVPQTCQQISAVSGLKFTILWGHVEDVLLFNTIFPIVDTCLSCEDTSRQSCAMVPRWLFFASCIFSEPRAVHFRPAF